MVYTLDMQQCNPDPPMSSEHVITAPCQTSHPPSNPAPHPVPHPIPHPVPHEAAHRPGSSRRLTASAGLPGGPVTATGQPVGGNAAAGLSQDADSPEPRLVLAKALANAGRGLGLSQEAVGVVIGRERTTFSRGLDPASKAGELALLLIRCYRSLFTLVGGDADNMRHWMHTENRDTGGIPAEQVRSVQGLARVTEYLDAMRGHG